MKKIYVLTILAGILATGCEKDYLNRYPEDQPSSETYYTTADQLILAINSSCA